MAKVSFSLSDVLAYASSNGLDTSDLNACKEAYRLHLEGKEEKEEKRAYNRKLVSVTILIPQGTKKGDEVKPCNHHLS